MARLLDSCADFARSFPSNGEVLTIECHATVFVRESGWKVGNRVYMAPGSLVHLKTWCRLCT